jgi:hypothetical protein
MYLVVRTYEHTDQSYGEEGFRRVREDLLPLLSEMDGFVSYCSAYDPDRGTVTSVSIYWTREAAEEANRAAVEWGSKNLATMGTVNPTAWVGDILVAAEALPLS